MVRRLFNKQTLLLLGLMILLMMLSANVVSAARRTGLRMTVDCDGITSRGGGIILTHDNTGQGRETFNIVATDGTGAVLFSATESSWVGTEITFLSGLSFDWTTAPETNPIRLEVISPAGNGFDEQVVYATLGSCSGEAFVGEDGTVAVLDFSTSPSVPLNGTPPRVSDTDNLNVTEAGYVVVTNIGTVNLRSGDGIEYTIVGQAEHNDALAVNGRNEDRSWWLVTDGDIRGWVNATLVAVRGNLTDVPVATIDGEILPARLFIFTDQTLYAAPDSLFELCVIEGGLEYAIVGRNRGGTWYEIEADCGVDGTGWISSEFGAFRNSGLSIPVTE